MWKWGFVFVFAGTEAQGGALTGPLENLYDISFLLFAVTLVLVFLFPRVSAWITMGRACSRFRSTYTSLRRTCSEECLRGWFGKGLHRISSGMGKL
jgi:hypothetical protein